MMPKDYEIKFNREGLRKRDAICTYFGWRDIHLTVNGHCIVRVRPEHQEVFDKTVGKHIISIIKRL